MSHSPPVPSGNVSPYPLQPAPHVVTRSDGPPPGADVIATPDAATASLTPAAIAFGAAALLGGAALALMLSGSSRRTD